MVMRLLFSVCMRKRETRDIKLEEVEGRSAK